MDSQGKPGAGSGKIDLSRIDAMAREAKVGRRPSPEPEDPKARHWVLIRGILLGCAVVAFVIVVIFVIMATSDNPFA